MIKDIVFMATQGVAIAVYILFMLDKNEIKLIDKQSITGLLLLMITYTIYWFVQNVIAIPDVLWEITLGTGSLVLVHSLVKNLGQQQK